MSEQPDPAHQRPDGVDDATVDAVGKIGEAVEGERRVREALMEGKRHVQEAERKAARRIDGPHDDVG